MKHLYLILIAVLSFTVSINAQKKTNKMNKKVTKTEIEWKSILTDQEYFVLRQKGTDQAGDEGYTQHFEKGTYVCRACNAQLFESGSKYESHCGWPSFDDAIKGTVDFTKDSTCTQCDGHLGHIFDDGPKETTGKRYCVNTSSIKFVKAN